MRAFICHSQNEAFDKKILFELFEAVYGRWELISARTAKAECVLL